MAVPEAPLSFWAEMRLILSRAAHVWRLVPPRHKVSLGLSAACMAVTSGCATAIALCLGKLIDGIKSGLEAGASPKALWENANFYLTLLIATYLTRELLNVVRRVFAERTCVNVEKEMAVRLIDHLMRVDLSSLNAEKIGALHGRIQRSVTGFVRFLRLSVLEFGPAMLTGAIAFAVTLAKEPRLGLVMIGVVPISIYLTVRQLISQKGVRLGLNQSREDMDGTVVELLHGLDYVRASDTAGLELARVDAAASRRRDKEVRHHFEMSLYGCAKALNEVFFHILVLAGAAYLATRGEAQIGDVVTFSMLFMNVMTPLAEIHRVLDDGHESSIQVGILLGLLAEPVDRSFEARACRAPQLGGDVPVVAVEDLHLVYRTPDGRERPALGGVSLTVRHGETVGVAGRSGAGKSTWLRVLLRLAHPTKGRVLIGGVPLEDVSRAAIGKTIGYVGQSPFIVAGTVRENIAYGCPGATDAEVRAAAERACILAEIEAMPGGFDAKVTERGTNLSGGQRQRLALARVFLKNPPILVLDEGTSALDNISERTVQRAIEAARADRTVILVAHRLTTLRDASRILVFEGGRIVETGRYDELLSANGPFAELARHAEEQCRA